MAFFLDVLNMKPEISQLLVFQFPSRLNFWIPNMKTLNRSLILFCSIVNRWAAILENGVFLAFSNMKPEISQLLAVQFPSRLNLRIPKMKTFNRSLIPF